MLTFNFFNLFIELLTILALLSAVAVITSTNPVLAIIFLILVFINAAVYLIINGLGFIGISYIIVYIGAITVFFLFVIMMISTEIIDTVAIGAEFGKILPLIYSLSVFFLYLFILFIPSFLFKNNDLATFASQITGLSPEGAIVNYTSIKGGTAFTNIATGFTSEILYLLNTYLFSNNYLNIISSPLNDSLIYGQSTSESYLITINSLNNIFTILNNYTNMYFTSPDSLVVPVLQIQILSEAVYGFVAFLLILTSFLLLLAMISPIILTKK